MANFVMMVGLPGCGKSTYSNKLAQQGFVVYSSDAIRNELNMHENTQTAKVFEIMHKRIKVAMQENKDIVYDATNLSRKRRMAYLESIKKYNYHKICYLFIVPLEVCMERNALRTGYARVPDHVYNNMLRAFQIPMIEEGWDEIIPILYDGKIDIKYNYDDLDNFSQDNNHHSLTLGQHMKKATQYVINHTDNDIIIEATKYHDIGKIYTKEYKNFRGEPTKEAHFYGHDNCGAYMYLIYWLASDKEYKNKFPLDKALTIGKLINWHMTPLLRWDKSQKAYLNDRKIISDEFYDMIRLMHEGDMYAH